MKALFIRTDFGLVPDQADARSESILAGVPVGSVVEIDLSRSRNVQFLRLYWALCKMIADAAPGFHTPENVSDCLKLEVGHYTVCRSLTSLYRLPRSISFAKMDEAEFREFFNRCARAVCENWLPGMQPGALVDEIYRMIGVPVEVAA